MLGKFSSYTISILLFLSPILFWTLTPNFFATPKQSLLLLATLTLVVVYGLRIYATKSIPLPKSHLLLPLLLFMSAIALNLIFVQEGRAESLSGKGSTLLILPLFTFLLLTHKNSSKLLAHTKIAILASTLVLAIHSLLQLTFLHSLSILPLYMQTTTFTLTGSYLTTLTLLLIGASLAVVEIKHSTLNKYFLFATLLISIISAVAIISLMLPGGSLALSQIPYIESWSIALDALKSAQTLFVGVGLANFSSLYTSVKPLTLNATSLWNTLPLHSSSELITLLATTGLTGALSLLYLMFKGLVSSLKSPLIVPFILTSLSLLFTPGSLPLYLLFFVLLAFLKPFEPHYHPLNLSAAWTLSFALIVSVLVLGYFGSRPYLAEYHMRQAQLALAQNDGKAVYEHHLQAIAYSPNLANYHLSLSDVNFSLASALSQKPELSDTDRDNISLLVQQSIQEAKIAINLRPNSSTGWLTMAKIYRNLIGVAEGSDQFAIQAYSQAISLDPANPSLRVEFGGLFYQLAQAETNPENRNAQLARAVSEFQVAIKLKPDYANAYYNLAKSLELATIYPEAITAMQQAIAYTSPDSSDYGKALSELEVLKTKLPKPGTTPPPPPSQDSETAESTLTTPSPLPSPLPGGLIELDE